VFAQQASPAARVTLPCYEKLSETLFGGEKERYASLGIYRSQSETAKVDDFFILTKRLNQKINLNFITFNKRNILPDTEHLNSLDKNPLPLLGLRFSYLRSK
jgi:hypothetical protein